MNLYFRYLQLVLAVAAFTLFGCSSDEPAAPETPSNDTTTETSQPVDDTGIPETPGTSLADTDIGTSEPPETQPKDDAPQTSPPDSNPPAVTGDGADAAIMAVVRGIQNNKAEAIWEFFPASYQKDINDLVHGFAANADPELWNKSFDALKKVVAILKDKKGFVLNSAMMAKSKVRPEELEGSWDEVIELLNIVVSSEISDVEKMKTLDTGEFLAGTGTNALQQLRKLIALNPSGEDPFAKLSQVKATLVESDSETATVELESPGKETKNEQFVKVEGKWIPQSMAGEWASKMQTLKANLAEKPKDENPERKKLLLATLANFDASLDKLAAAETQEDFDLSLQQTIVTAFGAVMMLAPKGDKPTPDPNKPDADTKPVPKPNSDKKNK